MRAASPRSSSSFARSYASDFSPASSDGRRGGATGALSPPTTHDVHLAPFRRRAPTGAAACSSSAHGACALRHRDRMAPVVVAANSRGGYPRLPTEQRVTTSSCSARAQQSRESPTRCRMVAVVPMRTLLVKTRRDRGQADGADGRVKWDRSKRLRRRAACPLVRSPCERRPWIESLGAPVSGVWRSRRRAIKTRSCGVGLSPGARNTTQTAEQSSAQAHSSCEQGAGQRDRSSARAGARTLGGTGHWPPHFVSTHTHALATICEHGDHSHLLPSVCAGVSGAGR